MGRAKEAGVIFRRFAADQRGASLVEFALVTPMFLALLLSIFEIAVLGMVSAGFDNALVAASRRIRTGETDMPNNAAQFKKLICDNMAGSDCKQRVNVTVSALAGDGYAGFAAAGAAYSSGAAGNASTPLPNPSDGVFMPTTADQVVLVTATYRWPVATPFLGDVFRRTAGGDVLISEHQLFKTEPYL
jgi:Flp pilus assembly protein TadG